MGSDSVVGISTVGSGSGSGSGTFLGTGPTEPRAQAFAAEIFGLFMGRSSLYNGPPFLLGRLELHIDLRTAQSRR